MATPNTPNLQQNWINTTCTASKTLGLRFKIEIKLYSISYFIIFRLSGKGKESNLRGVALRLAVGLGACELLDVAGVDAHGEVRGHALVTEDMAAVVESKAGGAGLVRETDGTRPTQTIKLLSNTPNTPINICQTPVKHAIRVKRISRR